MSERSPWTVLLVAHGTIAGEDEIPDFLREIRHGREAPPALIEEMRHRYRAIGGSPLLEQTTLQARALEERLGLPVRVAMRFSAPRIDSVLADLPPESEVCLVPMAPFSVPVYEAAVRRALEGLPHPPTLCSVEPWAKSPPLVAYWARVIAAALGPLRGSKAEAAPRLILTAHSLPSAVIAGGDRYQVEFESQVGAVLSAAGVHGVIAYQSQGKGGGSWLGPSLEERLDEAARAGERGVLLAPLGFLCEHVETLFDLDVEAKAHAERLGLSFSRLRTPGAAPNLIDALELAVSSVLSARAKEAASG